MANRKPKPEIVLMPMPPSNETDTVRIVDYIRAMTLELATMADHAGQPLLAEHLRATPSMVERSRVRHN